MFDYFDNRNDNVYPCPITLAICLILCTIYLFYNDRKVIRKGENCGQKRRLMVLSIIGFLGCLTLFLHVHRSTSRERKVDSEGYIHDLLKLLKRMKLRAEKADSEVFDLQKLVEKQMKTYFEEVDETMSNYEQQSLNLPKILAVLNTQNYSDTLRAKCDLLIQVDKFTTIGNQIKKPLEMIEKSYQNLKAPWNAAKEKWKNLTKPTQNGIGTPTRNVEVMLSSIPPLLDKIQEGVRKSKEWAKRDKEEQYNTRKIFPLIPFFISASVLFLSFLIMMCTIINNFLHLKSPFPMILSIITGLVYVIIFMIALFLIAFITWIVSNKVFHFFPCSNTSLPLDDFEYMHHTIENGRDNTNLSDVLAACNYSRRIYTLLDVYIPQEEGAKKLQQHAERIKTHVFPIVYLFENQTFLNNSIQNSSFWFNYTIEVPMSLIEPNISQEIDKANEAIEYLGTTMRPSCREAMSQVFPHFVPFVLNADETPMNEYLENVTKAEKYLEALKVDLSSEEVESFYRNAVRKLNDDIDPSHLQCGQILGIFHVGGCQDSDDGLRDDLELNGRYIIGQCIILLICWFCSNNLIHMEEKACDKPQEFPFFPIVPGITTCGIGETKQKKTPEAKPKSSKAPVTGSKAPVTGSKAPEAKPKGSKAPAVKPSGSRGATPNVSKSPEAKQKTPEAKPKTPEAKQKTPEAKPKTPEAKPKTPEAKPKIPEAKPKTPEGNPKTPEAKPKTPEGNPKTPEAKPKTPEAKQKTMASRTQESRMSASRTQNSPTRTQKSKMEKTKFSVTKTQDSKSIDAPQ